MGTKVSLQSVLDICDPRRIWPWSCAAPDAETLRYLLKHATEVAEPVHGGGTAELHIGRVLYLARCGWDDPIELDVGVPCLGYPGPVWPLLDGNHRVWAASLRGDSFIDVDVTGQVDHAAKLLNVSEAELTGL